MPRDNPNYPPWHCFTVCKCTKCSEWYEADREHICKKKNSYPLVAPEGKKMEIKKWEYKGNET